MNNLTRWSGILGLGGIFALGGLNASPAFQQGPAEFDVNSLISELRLDDNTAAEIAPELEKLTGLLAERSRVWDEGDDIRRRMEAIFSNLSTGLTFEQSRYLRRAFWEAGEAASWERGMGGRTGWMMGSVMRSGHDRYCADDFDRMEGLVRSMGMRGQRGDSARRHRRVSGI
jgi:hypothetical protein